MTTRSNNRGLARYRRRRDFKRTPEPRGQRGKHGDSLSDEPVFVVQLHDASSPHFDFRLEADGVLKSWAVPKGPSTDPGDKRLATPTEDHPLAYRHFEGIIPEGQYGGGAVIVWDEGTYSKLTVDDHGEELPLSEALQRGHASFRLNGHKLHGAYSLTRFRGRASGDRDTWLLVKHGHAHAHAGADTATDRDANADRQAGGNADGKRDRNGKPVRNEQGRDGGNGSGRGRGKARRRAGSAARRGSNPRKARSVLSGHTLAQLRREAR